jgi:hypothetical protein
MNSQRKSIKSQTKPTKKYIVVILKTKKIRAALNLQNRFGIGEKHLECIIYNKTVLSKKCIKQRKRE